MDEAHYEDPMTFKPERFLDQDNKFVGASSKNLWFGIGKRRCAGEILARAEVICFNDKIN